MNLRHLHGLDVRLYSDDRLLALVFLDQRRQFLGRQTGDLADPPPRPGGTPQQPQPLDIVVRVQSAATLRAAGLDHPVPLLPGAEDIGGETCAPNHDLDRVAFCPGVASLICHTGTSLAPLSRFCQH